MAGKKPKPAESKPDDQVGYVSEWFGHRVHPTVAISPDAIGDQKGKRCPFLSRATDARTECIKTENAKGVCTISACSNGPRQDWLVCPFRALDPAILQDAARRIFSVRADENMTILPAPVLEGEDVRRGFEEAISSGNRGLVYLSSKLGGEISLSATPRSPQLSFDITIAEIQRQPDGSFAVGRYGILEVQTMDFHGTYKHVVKNLEDALRLHGPAFPVALQQNQRWLCDEIEGPNIANVFKRTFYQMMLKFQIAGHGLCAGCVFAIPASVWDSWQRHLGAPELSRLPNGEFALLRPDRSAPAAPAWIYVFDIVASAEKTPNDIALQKVVVTDTESMSYFAFKVAPEFALAEGGAVDRLFVSLQRRLSEVWPGLRRPSAR